ncbi:MAG: hypothetical protein HRU12_25350 [Phaeodactylibacter sp.]|nr:hypothetical protein [Phaeodactylibacter sp.]
MKKYNVIIFITIMLSPLLVFAQPDIQEEVLPMRAWSEAPAPENWEMALSGTFLPYEDYWSLNTLEPVMIKVVNQDGNAVANASVDLLSVSGELLWSSLSDHQGVATLQVGDVAPKHVVARLSGLEVRKEWQPGQELTLDLPCQELKGADVKVLLDATHSMKDEFEVLLSTLKEEGYPVILGRDIGERFLLQSAGPDLAPDFTFQAAGGGPDEEAIDSLLLAAVEQTDWDATASSRVLVYLTDAQPDHAPESAERMRRAIRLAAQKGIAIWPVACSGLNEETEYLLQSMAVLTGGQYGWLEDTPANTAVHRRPILSVNPVASTLSKWLSAQTTAIGEFNSCSSQPEEKAGEETIPASFGCFPNPARTRATIKVPALTKRITLFNAAGQPVRQWHQVEAGHLDLKVTQLSAGAYTIEAIAGADRWTESLIVIR